MFFHCLCSALMGKAWFLLFCHPLKLYMILYSTGTVFFHCLIVFWGLAKTSESLTFIRTYERERERERGGGRGREREKVHCKSKMWCTVYFIINLFNVDNVLLCVIYQLNFTVFMYVTRISRYMTLYITFGIIRGFP